MEITLKGNETSGEDHIVKEKEMRKPSEMFFLRMLRRFAVVCVATMLIVLTMTYKSTRSDGIVKKTVW